MNTHRPATILPSPLEVPADTLLPRCDVDGCIHDAREWQVPGGSRRCRTHAPTVPAPRDRIAEWEALQVRRSNAQRVERETGHALSRLVDEMTPEEKREALRRWDARVEGGRP